MTTMLRQKRIQNGWTQEYVGKEVGITAEAIGLIETGQRKPSYDVLIKLLDLFGYDDPRKLFAPAPEIPKE